MDDTAETVSGIGRGPMRQSNIELLRIIAAMGVIALHYNNPGIGGGFRFAEDGSVNRQIMIAMECLFIGAVDLFMIISGYFQCKNMKASSRKVIELLMQLVVFEVLLYGMKVLSGQDVFSWSGLVTTLVPTDYFIVLYCTTYLLSPYMNLLLTKLSLRQFRGLLLLVFLLFSVQGGLLGWVENLLDIDLASASTYSYKGDQEGYTIVTFILCYLIGAGIRYGVIDIKRPLYSGLLFAGAFYMVWRRHDWSYCTPFVVLQAAAVFMLFLRLPLKDSPIINKIAKASLTVYILHETLLVRTGIKFFASGPAGRMLLHILAVQVGIYAVCFVVYLLWSRITKPVFAFVFTRWKAPDIDLETDQI